MTPIREKITELLHNFNPEGGNTATSPAIPATSTENSKAPGKKLKIGRNVALAIAGIALVAGAYYAPAMVDTAWISVTAAIRIFFWAVIVSMAAGSGFLIAAALDNNKTGIVSGLALISMTVAMLISPHMRNLDNAATATRIAQSIDRGAFPETPIPAIVANTIPDAVARDRNAITLEIIAKSNADPENAIEVAKQLMDNGALNEAKLILRSGLVTTEDQSMADTVKKTKFKRNLTQARGELEQAYKKKDTSSTLTGIDRQTVQEQYP